MNQTKERVEEGMTENKDRPDTITQGHTTPGRPRTEPISGDRCEWDGSGPRQFHTPTTSLFEETQNSLPLCRNTPCDVCVFGHVDDVTHFATHLGQACLIITIATADSAIGVELSPRIRRSPSPRPSPSAPPVHFFITQSPSHRPPAPWDLVSASTYRRTRATVGR